MADTQQSSRENGVHSAGGKRKQSVVVGDDASSSSSTPALLKKMKMESDAPPEANPNTMEAVKEKNCAMELELREKNRRIAYLVAKCEALYRGRAVADTSFRCVRRQWLQLHDDLASALHAVSPSNGGDGSKSNDSEDDEWCDVVDAVECFGLLRTQPGDLQIFLPEWFLAISKIDAEQQDEEAAAAEHSNGSDADGNRSAHDEDRNNSERSAVEFIAKEDLADLEKQIHEQLTSKYEDTKQLLREILGAVAKQQPAAASIEFKKIVQEKRTAVAQALALKDQVQTYQARIQELERDVQMKEVERHRACRDFDRLSKFVERNESLVDPSEIVQAAVPAASASVANGSDVKIESDEDKSPEAKQTMASLREAAAATADEMAQKDKTIAVLKDNHVIMSKKLYQERAISAELKKELEKFRALEAVWKKEEAGLKQDYEEKLEHLRDEKNSISEEFSKIRHKAKDIETHVNEKWKKKMARLQADMTKVKTQMDELNLKNVAFREKLSNASAQREQLHEYKSTNAVLASENATLKVQVECERQKNERSASLVESQEVVELTQKVELLEKSKKELEESFGALQQSASADENLASLVSRQSELDAKYEQELLEHAATKTAVEKLRLEIEALQATEAASREENDALISEIDMISKEMESLRQGRKKLTQQVEEKRNSNKKLHTQLSKEEQAKAHCFEELAAVRLQASSLGTVHKQQKVFIESIKESLHAKEKELETLKEFVKNLESEKETADAEKRRVVREAEVTKQIYMASIAETSQRKQQLLQEQRKPCEKCEVYKKKEEKYEKLLQQQTNKATPAAAATGELNDLERFELKELQKLVNCSVCQDQRKNVLIGKCFHMFCRDCVDSNLRSRNRKCPTCKKMFGQDDVKAVWFT